MLLLFFPYLTTLNNRFLSIPVTEELLLQEEKEVKEEKWMENFQSSLLRNCFCKGWLSDKKVLELIDLSILVTKELLLQA